MTPREIEEDIARGRLIAAAPDMLRILKSVRGVLALNGSKKSREVVLAAVRAIIREAEGTRP